MEATIQGARKSDLLGARKRGWIREAHDELEKKKKSSHKEIKGGKKDQRSTFAASGFLILKVIFL